jgi:hypothetical protein
VNSSPLVAALHVSSLFAFERDTREKLHTKPQKNPWYDLVTTSSFRSCPTYLRACKLNKP